MRVKRRRLSVVLLVYATFAGACGAGPDAHPADLDEVRTRVSGLTSEGKVQEALAEAEAFLQRNPDAAHAHLLMTEAVGQMAETASDPERTTFLERTAMHHERVVELTKVSTLRTFSLGALVAYHGPKYLNRPERAETYARRIITDSPGEAVSYVYLVDLLKSARRFDDAAQALIEARKAVSNDPFQQAHLGDLMVDLADSRHGASIDTRRRLLDQAQAIADEGLKAHRAGVEAEAFRQLKSQATRAQGQLQPDPKQ
jgi:tetratricopeptide (TPR) repeat protein